MQVHTLERLTTTLPMVNDAAWIELSEQIIRLHAIIERTNSRHSREQREVAAQARRELREQQRKERQAQKEADSIARNQRNKDRDEQRSHREQQKSARAEQKVQLLMRKFDLADRKLKLREDAFAEKRTHSNSGMVASSRLSSSEPQTGDRPATGPVSQPIQIPAISVTK